MKNQIYKDIEHIYEWAHSKEGLETVSNFHKDQEALQILTVTDFLDAKKKVEKIKDRIKGKCVVEIGAGVGFIAIEMAKYAEEVVAIESDPSWNLIFTQHLYKHKPDNLIWVFGEASTVRDIMPYEYDQCGDMVQPYHIAVIFTRSGINQMKKIGGYFANEVIMYYQEYERG